MRQRQCQFEKVRGGAARRSSTSGQHKLHNPPVCPRTQPIYWFNYVDWYFIMQKQTRIMLLLLSKSGTSDMSSNNRGACASSEQIRWRRIEIEKDESTPESRTRLHVSSEIASAKALRMLSMNISALSYFPAI